MRRLAYASMAFLLVASGAAYAEEVEQDKRLVRRLYDELFLKWNFAVG